MTERRHARRHPFNMIEVVLGLGLISFGLISTLGLFPIGLSASRDSIAESYAADSADQLLHFMATRLKDPGAAGNFPNWDTVGNALPDSKNTPIPPAPVIEPSTWQNWFSDDTTTFLYAVMDETDPLKKQVFYKVEQRPLGSTVPDFSAIYRVWREKVTMRRYDPVANLWLPEEEMDYSVAMGINIEISWPSNIPYASRQKSLYHIEVYKPQ